MQRHEFRPGWRDVLHPLFYDRDGMPQSVFGDARTIGYRRFWTARKGPTGAMVCSTTHIPEDSRLLDMFLEWVIYMEHYGASGIGGSRFRYGNLTSHGVDEKPAVEQNEQLRYAVDKAKWLGVDVSDAEYCVHVNDDYEKSRYFGPAFWVSIVDARARDCRLKCLRAILIILHPRTRAVIQQRDIRIIIARMSWELRADAVPVVKQKSARVF